MSPRKMDDPAAALRWMRDTPHWNGAAIPEHVPTGLRLSGTRSIVIPSATLDVLMGLYKVSRNVHRIGDQLPKTSWRMFVPTTLGNTYLQLVDDGVRFGYVNGHWMWSHHAKSHTGFYDLLEAVENAASKIPGAS